MRLPVAILITATALSVGACASNPMMSAQAGSRTYASSARDRAGCVPGGGYAQGYDIPICHVTNDATLWPQ